MNIKHTLVKAAAAAMLIAPMAIPALAAEGTTAQGGTVVCASTHIIQSGETLYRIARRYGTTVAELQRLNGLGTSTTIYAGNGLCVKAQEQATGREYTVQRGDTLSRIARRFGVDMKVLARVNNIADANKIFVGQKLIIPDFTTQ